ncbi:MFS transporter [Rahnella selenatireducens]|uniref:MFS transporter n=1 Tax=Rahnella selenatireducens TaxID=3389797 RepID=UPI0039686ACB
MTQTYPQKAAESPVHAHWSAVFSIALSVVSLVTAEILPVSLLTPIATDLGISEGMAGQAVSATSIMGMIASLFIAAACRRVDRRLVLLGFTLISIASNVIVAAAPDYTVLLIGRLLLGISLGGFWSMAAAVSMRLVHKSLIPKALSVIFGGVSVAMAVATPLGTWLSAVTGWRGVFLVTAALGIITFVWQYSVFPSMKPAGQTRLSTLFGLLKRPQIRLAMAGMVGVFGGHFAFFTYLRPLLENVSHFNVSGVSAILLGFGIANILGTAASGMMLRRSLKGTLLFMPLILALMAAVLVRFGESQPVTAILVTLWGFVFGAVPVAWTTWLTYAVPDETESGGGLQVASIQLAITAGATLGGLLLDAHGTLGTVTGSGIILLLSAGLIGFMRCKS